MTTWTDVAAEADLFEGAGIAAEPVGHDIALFSIDAQVLANDNLCTHDHAQTVRWLYRRPRYRVPDSSGKI